MIRPEINKLKYWIHLALIVGVVWATMQIWNPVSEWEYFLSSFVGLSAGDIIAHNVLRLD